MAQDRTSEQEFSLDALTQDVQSLKDLVDLQSRRDVDQQRAFDALYEELRQYKDDFVFQSEKPLLLDLLLFYDSLNWFQQSLVKQEMSPEVIADSFQYLIDEFLELLYRRDVLPMESKDHIRPGDPESHQGRVLRRPGYGLQSPPDPQARLLSSRARLAPRGSRDPALRA